MPQFAGSQVIYGGSAGPGLFTELKDGVDGLFLGRFAHDPAAVELILDETLAELRAAGRGPPAGGKIMTIGLSTYAFLWRSSDRVENPLTLHDILEHTRASGCSLLQICDFAPLDELSVDGLSGLARAAGDLGIQLELGTRGVGPDHLRRYLEMATHLGSRWCGRCSTPPPSGPRKQRPSSHCGGRCRDYAERGVTLALETYEQVPSAQLVRIIEAVDSEALGVCLDPAQLRRRAGTARATSSPRRCRT